MPASMAGASHRAQRRVSGPSRAVPCGAPADSRPAQASAYRSVSRNSSTKVARITAGAICVVLSSTATAMPPMAATPLTRPDTSPVASRIPRVGVNASRQPLRSSRAAPSSSTPISRRSGSSSSQASTAIPSGMHRALPSTSQLSQDQLASRKAARNSVRLASTSSTKIGGTTWAGGANSDSPATHSAEKPKPAKPRTMPAASTISSAVSSRAVGRGGDTNKSKGWSQGRSEGGRAGWPVPRAQSGAGAYNSTSLSLCTLPDGPRGRSLTSRNSLGVL